MNFISKYLTIFLAAIVCITSFDAHALTDEQKKKVKSYSKNTALYATLFGIPFVLGYLIGRKKDGSAENIISKSQASSATEAFQENGDEEENNEEENCGTGIVHAGSKQLPSKVLNAHNVLGARKTPRFHKEESISPDIVQPVTIERPKDWQQLLALWQSSNEKKLTRDEAQKTSDIEHSLMNNWLVQNKKQLFKKANRLLNIKEGANLPLKNIEDAAAGLLLIDKYGKDDERSKAHSLMEQLAERYKNYITYKETGTCRVVTPKTTKPITFRFKPKRSNQASRS